MVQVPLVLRALPPEVAAIVAAAGDAGQGLDPTSVLLQYGVLGLAVAVLGPFAYGAYRRERTEVDRLKAQIDEMHKANLERVIPALLTATEVLRDSQQLVRDIARDRHP